jgi:hypothetical protein
MVRMSYSPRNSMTIVTPSSDTRPIRYQDRKYTKLAPTMCPHLAIIDRSLVFIRTILKEESNTFCVSAICCQTVSWKTVYVSRISGFAPCLRRYSTMVGISNLAAYNSAVHPLSSVSSIICGTFRIR